MFTSTQNFIILNYMKHGCRFVLVGSNINAISGDMCQLDYLLIEPRHGICKNKGAGQLRSNA